MKIYCSCCDKVQPVRIDNCRDAKTNEPFQDIVCAECDLVIAAGTDIVPPAQQEPVGEITAEDMGRPFNAIRINTHFYKEIPPVGTKLYTTPQPPAQPLTDDPLQGAVDWLLEADGEYFCTATVQRTLRIGYNRAKRLCDTAKERAVHGITKGNT